jgi:hypothetical protein
MKDVDRQALAAALADAGRILDEAVDQLATDQTGVTALETNELLLLRSEAKQSIGRLQGMAMALRILKPRVLP